jgi:hypothetical protein
MKTTCLDDGILMIAARRLPGAAVTTKVKRVGSHGHARSARILARRGRGMGTTSTTSTTSIRSIMGARSLAHPGPGASDRTLVPVSGAWPAISRLAPAAGGSRLALVVGDQVDRALWGAVI